MRGMKVGACHSLFTTVFLPLFQYWKARVGFHAADHPGFHAEAARMHATDRETERRTAVHLHDGKCCR